MNSTKRKELWEKYCGDKSLEIRNEIVEQYLDLVQKEANKIKVPAGIERDDIFQYGVLGLINAVDRYQPQEGKSFESYASYKVKGEIIDRMREYGRITQGFSRTKLKKKKEIEKAISELEAKHNRKASCKEIMEMLDIEEKEFGKLQMNTSLCNGVSLDVIYESGRYTKKEIDDGVNAETEVLQEEAEKTMKMLIEQLKPAERIVIERHYFNQEKIGQIAECMGVSEARISQLHKKALRSLRALITQ